MDNRKWGIPSSGRVRAGEFRREFPVPEFRAEFRGVPFRGVPGEFRAGVPGTLYLSFLFGTGLWGFSPRFKRSYIFRYPIIVNLLVIK